MPASRWMRLAQSGVFQYAGLESNRGPTDSKSFSGAKVAYVCLNVLN